MSGEQQPLVSVPPTGRSAATGEPMPHEAATASSEAETDREALDTAPPARHLRVIDGDGQVLPGGCPECAAREFEVEGLQETVRSQGAKIRKLRRDRDSKARGSALWPDAVELHRYWKAACGHPRSKFDVDRFLLLEPYLKSDGLDLCKLAVDGAAHDPYRANRPNRNGKTEVYDSLETIFKTRAAFERHCNRAPAERVRQLRESVPNALGVTFSPLEQRLRAELMIAQTEGLTPADALEQAAAELSGRRPPRVDSGESVTDRRDSR